MLRTEGQLLFPSEHGKPLPNNTLNRWYTKLCTDAFEAVWARAIPHDQYEIR